MDWGPPADPNDPALERIVVGTSWFEGNGFMVPLLAFLEEGRNDTVHALSTRDEDGTPMTLSFGHLRRYHLETVHAIRFDEPTRHAYAFVGAKHVALQLRAVLGETVPGLGFGYFHAREIAPPLETFTSPYARGGIVRTRHDAD